MGKKRSSKATPYWEYVIAGNDPEEWTNLAAIDKDWWRAVAAQKNENRKGPHLTDVAKAELAPGKMLRIEDRGRDLAFHYKPTTKDLIRWEENKQLLLERAAEIEAKRAEEDGDESDPAEEKN